MAEPWRWEIESLVVVEIREHVRGETWPVLRVVVDGETAAIDYVRPDLADVLRRAFEAALGQEDGDGGGGPGGNHGADR